MKQYPAKLKNQVRNLRSRGLTYREICTQIKHHIPKGTLSSWLKDVPLSSDYYQKIKDLGYDNIYKAQAHNKKALSERLNQLRDKNIDLVQYINKPVGKLLLATLYWCEGNKYPGSRCLRFGNSDSKMITLFITLLRQCYQIDESKFRMTIQCRSDQNQVDLSAYWTTITGIPSTQQYKSRVDSRSIGKSTLKLNYRGVCVIDYFDTNLQCELQFTGEYLGSDKSINLVKNQIK